MKDRARVQRTFNQRVAMVARQIAQKSVEIGECHHMTPLTIAEVAKFQRCSKTHARRTLETMRYCGYLEKEVLPHGRFGMSTYYLHPARDIVNLRAAMGWTEGRTDDE